MLDPLVHHCLPVKGILRLGAFVTFFPPSSHTRSGSPDMPWSALIHEGTRPPRNQRPAPVSPRANPMQLTLLPRHRFALLPPISGLLLCVDEPNCSHRAVAARGQ